LLATIDEDETTAVRSVFSWSFQALPAEAARMFRLFGLHAGADISIAAAATLAGTTVPQVRPLLDALHGVHLLEQAGPDRYRLHDLLRVYAADRAKRGDRPRPRGCRGAGARLVPADRHRRQRNLDCGPTIDYPHRQELLGSTDANSAVSFTTHEQAIAWFRTECANLVAAVGQASDAGQYDIAWKLPLALAHFFDMEKPTADWITVYHVGLTAAQQLNNRRVEAWILTDLANAHQHFGQLDKSFDYRQRSLTIFRELGDQLGEATNLCYLGRIHRRLGHYTQAVDQLQHSLAIWRALRNGQGEALVSTEHSRQRVTDPPNGTAKPSRATNRRWLSTARSAPCLGEGFMLHCLGQAYQRLHHHHHHQEAIDCL
jgi:tetratricopeptide (TPR) repeat protein